MKKETETELLVLAGAVGLILIAYFVLHPAQAANSNSGFVSSSQAALMPSYNPSSSINQNVSNPNGLYQNVDAALNYLTGHTYVPLFGLLGFSSLYNTWGQGLYTSQNNPGQLVL